MLQKLLNAGVKESHTSAETLIVRKLNFNSLVGIFNMLVGLIVFYFLGNADFNYLFVFSICGLSATILFNRFLGYLWASYCFFVCGFTFLTFISLMMGKDSLVFLFFFPMLMSLVQLYGRKELYKHLLSLGVIMGVSILLVVWGFNNHFMELSIPDSVMKWMMSLNIILSFSTMSAVAFMNVSDQIKHEYKMKKAKEEKEILLAEVYHRVKNNMNIVTSLLNLKKNSSEDPEVIEALEECRSRIFSMSLVHEAVYRNEKSEGLKLNEYIKRLSESVAIGTGEVGAYEVQYDLQEVELGIDHSIPCGMILNEVLTNAFKHAKIPGTKLLIKVKLENLGNEFVLTISDNGPGVDLSKYKEQGSLGIDLIESLAEQLDATASFKNENGLIFTLKSPFKG